MRNKILLVEDDPSISKLYQTKFDQENFNVVTAENGKKGLDLAISEKPDIILLDISLPILNGFEVLKKLRKNNDLKKTPIIILTNYGEMENITEGFLRGATEFMVKVEHTPEEVVDTVREVLSNNGSLITEAFKETGHKY